MKKAVTYTVITDNGDWGRAATLIKACKNAYITTRVTRATVYRTPDHLFEETYVTSYGGFGAVWSEAVQDRLVDENEMTGSIRGRENRAITENMFEACQMGAFDIKITGRGKLIMAIDN